LAKNIRGDAYPEIVFQNQLNEIVILDWQGRAISRFTGQQGTGLRALGEYNGNSCIITDQAIYLFDAASEDYGNHWLYPDGAPDNARKIALTTDPLNPDQSRLINWKKTYTYPNPSYGDKVTIRMAIETASKVEIEIYDIAGYPVKKMRLSSLITGTTNEISWNLDGIQSGVYFARIQVSKGNKTDEKIIKIGVIK
ncbi:MAG: T9SS type A sorting domain-containing protein, partial [Fidelibacterota bacterium]